MKITTSVIDNGLGRVSVESPLFKEYFLNFEGLIRNKFNPETPVTRLSADSLYIDIPIEKINDVLNLSRSFVGEAVKNKLQHTEFIPLRGYSAEDLKNDVVNANNGKRDFMLVDTFQNYEKHTQDGSYTFNQYQVKYGTSEWTDIFLDLYEKNLKSVRERYQDKLTNQNWI